MRRLSLMLVLVAVLAGCSSGSSNVASSKPTTTPAGTTSASAKAASPTTTVKAPKAAIKPTTGVKAPKGVRSTIKPKAAAAPHKVIIGGATTYCGAFVEMRSVRASDGPAVASAVYVAAAADMRTYAPAAIKSAALSYANVIDAAGKALKTKTMPTAAASKPADLVTVTTWVTKNCPR